MERTNSKPQTNSTNWALQPQPQEVEALRVLSEGSVCRVWMEVGMEFPPAPKFLPLVVREVLGGSVSVVD